MSTHQQMYRQPVPSTDHHQLQGHQILPQGHHHPYLAPNVLHPSGVNFSNFAGYPPSIASFSTGSQRGPQQVTDQMPPRCASEPIISNLEPSESQGVHPPACRCSSYLSQVLKQMKESAEQGVTEPEFELSWNNEDNTVFKYKGKYSKEVADTLMSLKDQAHRLLPQPAQAQVQATSPPQSSPPQTSPSDGKSESAK